MASTTMSPISFRNMPGFIRSVAVIYDPKNLKKDYFQVVANLMLNFIALRFSRSMDSEGNKWMSTADKTKCGGKFSINYKRRPSGQQVSSGSKRLFDTGTLMNSYKVLYISNHKVVVGPTGSRNVLIAEVAAEKWHNDVVGWSKKDVALASKEFLAYSLRTIKGN